MNIFTDSHYAFEVAHDFGMLWKQREFLTSSGQLIKNKDHVLALLDAIWTPKSLSILKSKDIFRPINKRPKEINWQT